MNKSFKRSEQSSQHEFSKKIKVIAKFNSSSKFLCKKRRINLIHWLAELSNAIPEKILLEIIHDKKT